MKALMLNIGIVLLGSLLFAAPFLSPRLAPLAFVGTVPWLVLILSQNKRRGTLMWFLVLVYLIGMTSLHWLGDFSLPAWFISPLFYIPLFLPPFYLTKWLRKFWPMLPVSLIWGLVFTGTEWLRIRISAGEIPFCQAGAALAPLTKLIQIADVGGASALSTLTALTSGFIFDLILLRSTTAADKSRRRLVLSGAFVLTIFGLTIIYGYWNDRPANLTLGPRLQIVQSNMPGWRDDLSSRRKLERAIQLTQTRPTDSDVWLVVWPENSVVPALNLNGAPDESMRQVADLAHSVAVPILIDGPYDITDSSERHRVALVHPNGEITTYAKQLFVPWSEYAPFESSLRALHPALADRYLQFIRSRNPYFTPTLIETDEPLTVFRYQSNDGVPIVFAAPVCYEVLSPRLVNRWYPTLTDEDRKHFFLINQVNEILVGDSVHYQTLALCQLRAVEGRVSVIRGTNNGISAAIDPNGRVYDQLIDAASGASTDVAGVFFPQVKLDPRGTRTIYARFGDWWPVTCLVSSILLIALGYMRQRARGFLKSLA